MKSNATLGEGVYYATADYAGMCRRVLALAADLGVVVLAWYGLWAALVLFDPSPVGNGSPDALPLIWLGLAYLYLVVVKPSRVRSLGYWLTGTKIVTLRGERPSILRMTFRLALWVLGPFNVCYDLIWMGIDDDRQSLRDAFAGTYVVKRNARPVGRGEIHLATYFAFGFTLMYPKVTRVSR